MVRGGMVRRSVTVDRLTEDGFCVWLLQSMAGGSGGGKASDGHANWNMWAAQKKE